MMRRAVDRRWWSRWTLGAAWLCAGASLAAEAAGVAEYGPPPAGQVRLVRDRYGVPHIIASDDRSLWYGVGYAQAEDQLENMYVNFLRGQGRAAEREGVSQLIFDHLVRLLEIPQRSQEGVTRIGDLARSHLRAYCDGVNAYMAEHRADVPDWIEPVEPAHILGFAQYVDMLFCVSDCRNDLERAGIKLVSWDALPRDDDAWMWGSNQFALAPQRTATGAALLSMDPHLPLEGFFRWYEMHLVGPEMNTMGACFFGSPYVSMGRTDRSAWCMTVNAPDLGDVFRFEVNPDDASQYRDVDGWRAFETSEETYLVAGLGGKPTKTKMACRRTSVGPVVFEKEGYAYVFALPLPEVGGRIEQLYWMARARSAQEFRDSLAPLGISMFNIVYADTAGDILYVSNGRVPRRDVRIDSRELRPGNEAWARWQGFHTLDELPQTTNPSSGYLLNTNSGPQNVTPVGAPDLDAFPPYMNRQQQNSRWRRLAELLEADSSVTWDEMMAYATDTQLEAGVRHVPKIVESLEPASSSDVEVAEFSKVLQGWDRRTDLQSEGAVLFVLLARSDVAIEAIEAGDSGKLVEEVKKVIAAVRKEHGKLDVPWEQFSRMRRGTVETGVVGCGIVGSRKHRDWSGAALRPTGGKERSGKRFCDVGSSYGMLVDFKGRTSAVSCLPYGVSEHEDSPHFADQMPLYSQGKFKPAWFWPDELAANTESERTLTVPAEQP